MHDHLPTLLTDHPTYPSQDRITQVNHETPEALNFAAG